MIVLEIDSGLGNQMFMYAAAKSLAVRHNTELFLDVDVACRDGYGIGQTFQLDHFNISASYANRDILSYFDADDPKQAMYEVIRAKIRESKGVRFLSKTLRVVGFNPSAIMPVGTKNESKLYEEPEEDWRFKGDFLNHPDNIYIKGYFPSFKYFSSIHSVLIEEFQMTSELSPNGKEVERSILYSDSIAVHFRRGDVVSNSKYKSWYDGVVTDNYYRHAISFFESLLNNPHFFVFSNDIEWVKDNFKISGDVTYVDHNGPESGYEDLYLMSKCKHNVTTGCSSFSWWGAYLNANPEKVVLRTKRMNYHDHLNYPDDFFPKEWVIIES